MRALRKTAPGAGLEWTTVPEPDCGAWDVKVRVLRAGICGTDLHILDWDTSAQTMCDTVPFTPGHEFYGEVVEVGQEVSDVRVGDRISGEG
ncbi:MAG: alcohol dehydrogenase catalytic domain-containing protein, partial [Brachybacterium sp.]